MASKTNYREIARAALNRAKAELDSSDEFRLRYAALELRMALEALVYERAQLYSVELNNKKLNTWQPSKLLNLLLEVDPHADKSPTISIGKEPSKGVPADYEDMIELGTDRKLSLKEIKQYYDSIGFYLHTPTIEQAEKLQTKIEGFRAKCNEVYKIIEEVLSSKIFNTNLKYATAFECMDCGENIIRRINPSSTDFVATCIKCEATYVVTKREDGSFGWKAITHEVECANPDCNEISLILDRDLRIGAQCKCKACNGFTILTYGLIYEPPTNEPK